MTREWTEEIEKVDVAGIASQMVKIPSDSFRDHQEEEVAFFVHHLFRQEGISSKLVEVIPGRYNVVAKIPGKGGGKSLLLTGHLDTVPPYDMEDPFSGEIHDGVLYGRGSCDMKGPLAAMIAAMMGIHRAKIALEGDLIFVGLIDEEEKGKGVEYLIQNGPWADAVINGEPTNLKPAIGHKGLEWMVVKIRGKTVHGGKMEEGINAIMMAARFLNRIQEEYMPALQERRHPVLGVPTINVGKIQGGDQPSTVPGSCRMEIDRRWVPAENREQVYQELKAILKALEEEDSAFHGELLEMFTPGELLAHPPFYTDPKDPLVLAAQEALEQEGVSPGGVTVFPAWSDAGTMAAFTSMKCIVLGPGDLALAHSGKESIPVEELRKAAKVYGRLACLYCGVAK
jgi:acetylornithine deacetylase/succinyl-diaminopimelate desuccinylase